MSDVLSARIGLSAEVIGQLDTLPQTIIATLTTARQRLEAVAEGTETDNPLSGLLEAWGGLAEIVGQAPELGPLLGPLSDLIDRLPGEPLGDVASITGQIESVLVPLRPVLDALGNGGVEDALRAILDNNVDLAASLGAGGGEEISEIAREFARFLELFAGLTRWGQQAPDVGDVVQILSNALVGVDPNLLSGPRSALDGVIAVFDELRPEGPDVDRLQGQAAELDALWVEIDARLDDEIDWPALEAALRDMHGLLRELRAVRDRLIMECLSGIEAFTPPDLESVADALVAVPQLKPARLTPLLDDLRRTLRGFVDGLERAAPSEAELRAAMLRRVEEYFENFEDTALAQLRNRLVALQRRLLAAIEGLPLRDAAAAIERALGEISRTLDGFDLTSLRREALRPIVEARQSLEAQAQETIAVSIGAVWEEVGTALEAVATQLESLRNTLQGAGGSVAGFLEEINEALATLESAIAEIAGVLEAFDLDEPCAAVVERLAELEAKIAAIDVSVIPEPALAPLDAAAGALISIDIAGSINGPLSEALKRVDPTPILDTAAAAVRGILDELRKLDPGSLIVELDAPVDEVLKQLANFGPEGLEQLLRQALEPVSEALQAIDFVALLAPISKIQRDLQARIDGLLDPNILLEPLNQAFQPILDVIDALEPTQYLGIAAGEGERASETVGARAGPPSAVADAGGLLRTELGGAVDGEDALFGFRPGDLLVPLIDLHNRLVQAVDSLDPSVLDDAARELRRALNGGLADLDPQAVEARWRGALDLTRRICEPKVMAAALLQPSQRYRGVSARIRIAAGAAGPDDRADAAAVLTLMAELDPLQLLPDPSQVLALDAALDRARRRLDLGGLRVAFAAKAPQLKDLLPDLLDDAALDGGGLRAALAALDPAPLREEINTLFDSFGARLVGMQGALNAALDDIGQLVEAMFLPVTPGRLVAFASDLHAGLKAHVAAVGPEAFRDELEPLFTAVRKQAAALDVGRLAEDLNAERDALIASIEDLVLAVLPDPAPFRELQVRLAALKPSQLLTEVAVQLTALTESIGRLDPDLLFVPLVEAMARIRNQIPEVIAKIEEAFDAVLAALPSGSGASASVSASASVGGSVGGS